MMQQTLLQWHFLLHRESINYNIFYFLSLTQNLRNIFLMFILILIDLQINMILFWIVVLFLYSWLYGELKIIKILFFILRFSSTRLNILSFLITFTYFNHLSHTKSRKLPRFCSFYPSQPTQEIFLESSWAADLECW